jgi:hypothetical protein
MADEETPRAALERILYSKIDAGLEKRDTYEIVDAIEALIYDKMAEAIEALSDRLEKKMGIRP